MNIVVQSGTKGYNVGYCGLGNIESLETVARLRDISVSGATPPLSGRDLH